MRTSTAIIILLLLSLTASAQKKANAPLWNYSDVLLGGSFIFDEASTKYAGNNCSYCREGGVLKDTRTRIFGKVAIFSAFKILEWRSPQVRKSSKWVKLGLAITFTVVSVSNAKK